LTRPGSSGERPRKISDEKVGKVTRPLQALVAVSLALVLTLSWNGCLRSEHAIRTELVHIHTEDRVSLAGLLRQPEQGGSRAGVVMVHGYGGNFYSGVMSFLPQALAARGVTTLAVNMRDHDLGPKGNLFEESRLDIAAAVNELARRGARPLFLYGHSMGTNRVLYYLAATGDPRVTGVILTGPPGNLFDWNVKMFGRDRASRVLREAQDQVAAGRGNQWMLVDLGPLGKALYTANHVVSLRGPQTLSDPFKNVAQITRPVLIVHGLADRLADPAVADEIRRDAPAPERIAVSLIPGADHSFHGHEKALEEVISTWLLRQLAP
jgi:pimeloyl-ACP methyl ester carboxylesterase